MNARIALFARNAHALRISSITTFADAHLFSRASPATAAWQRRKQTRALAHHHRCHFTRHILPVAASACLPSSPRVTKRIAAHISLARRIPARINLRVNTRVAFNNVALQRRDAVWQHRADARCKQLAAAFLCFTIAAHISCRRRNARRAPSCRL